MENAQQEGASDRMLSKDHRVKSTEPQIAKDVIKYTTRGRAAQRWQRSE